MSITDEKLIQIFSSREAIRAELVEYAKQYLDLDELDFANSSYLSYLINVLSVLTANLNYYTGSVYREFFLIRARQRESVTNIAHMVGFTPHLAAPSTVSILMSLNTLELNINGTIRLKSFYEDPYDTFIFKTNDGIEFSLTNTIEIDVISMNKVFLSANIRSIDKYGNVRNVPYRLSEDGQHLLFFVEAKQLRPKIDSYRVSALDAYQFLSYEIDLGEEFLSDIKVYSIIDNIEQKKFEETGKFDKSKAITWNYKESLFLSSPEERSFSYRLGQQKLKLFFGNNLLGKQPEANSIIVIELFLTKGEKGNIIPGSIKECSKIQLKDVVGRVKKLNDAICTNMSEAAGGSDYMTIDEIRAKTISHIASKGRLVTSFDYRDMENIVKGLPVKYPSVVLKRSDLKRNEICVFTAATFENKIVPTKNLIIFVNDPSEIEDTTKSTYTIKRRTLLNHLHRSNIAKLSYIPTKLEYVLNDYGHIDLSLESYITLFTIVIDKETDTCKYYYVLENNLKTLEFVERVSPLDLVETIYSPLVANFSVKDDEYSINDKLQVQLKVFILNQMGVPLEGEDISNLAKCKMKFSDQIIEYNLTPIYDTNTPTEIMFVNYDNSTGAGGLPLEKVPEGETEVIFTIEFYMDSQLAEKTVWKTNLLVKKDLSDIISSECIRITKTEDDQTTQHYIIYDVPCIAKEFYDYLKEDKTKQKLSDFEENVLVKLSTTEFDDYRMMTDYVNIKFSTTTGNLFNPGYNEPTYKDFVVSIIDPTNLPEELYPDQSMRGLICAVTNHINAWNIKDRGFLITCTDEYTDSQGRKIVNWDINSILKLKTNDIIRYKPLCIDGKARDEILLIYNGENLVPLVKEIPIRVVLDVWKKKDRNVSNAYLIEKIKATILEKLSNKFGFDKPLLISEITTAVLSVDDVLTCNVLQPDFDIFFNYKPEKLNSSDLIVYSPQLVFITEDSIEVRIRN